MRLQQKTTPLSTETAVILPPQTEAIEGKVVNEEQQDYLVDSFEDEEKEGQELF